LYLKRLIPKRFVLCRDIAAWAIDKEAWRSFRLETVISWEEGFPSGAKDGKVA
jgi:hypothetical protein